jgi:hypothetical protein
MCPKGKQLEEEPKNPDPVAALRGTPLPYEFLKMSADYTKWLAGISTAVVATSGSLVLGKIHGVTFMASYYLSLLGFTWTVAAAGTIMLSAAHMVQAFEWGKADKSHTTTAELFTKRTLQQWKVFACSLFLFAIAIIGSAITDVGKEAEKLSSPTPPTIEKKGGTSDGPTSMPANPKSR